jgi:hypothetical protein
MAMIKKRPFALVIAVMSLVACGQGGLPTQLGPTAPPPPATYHGNPLPTPQPIAEDEQVPPVWLIVQDKGVAGTLLGYRLFTEQKIETDGQQPYGYVIYGHEPGEISFVTYLEQVELASVSLVAGEQAVIVAPTSVTTFRARLVSAPLAAGGRSLKAEGITEDDAAIFTLEPTSYLNGGFLRVRLDFESPVVGAAEYVWQLAETAGGGPARATSVLAADAPPACTPPSPNPELAATALLPLPYRDGTGILPPEILAPSSDLIILGTVSGPAAGLEVPWGGGEPGHTTIVTDTPVQVECVLKGAPTGATVTVRVEGGCAERGNGEPDCVMVSHIRPLEVGQRLVLFLQHEGPDYVTRRREEGSYEIQVGPDYYARSGEFVVVGDRASNGFDELSLAELMARIASVHRSATDNVELARQTLITYFDYLSAGRYQEAAELYGGSYEVLAGHNPDLAPQDQVALLERACTVNGFQCLPVLGVALQGQVSPAAYGFSVAFADPGGRLFILRAAEPAQVQFPFTVVEESEGRFLVEELPVYLP